MDGEKFFNKWKIEHLSFRLTLTTLNYTRNYTPLPDFEKEEKERERKVSLTIYGEKFHFSRNENGKKILTVPAPPSTRSCPWWSWSSCTRTSSCSRWSSRSRDRTCAAVYSPSCRSCSLRAAISICHVPDPSCAPSSRLCADDDRTSDYPCRVSDR